MSIFYKRIYYRDFTIIPQKTLSGKIDCKIYKGHRNPETRTSGKRMRDICKDTLEDVKREIDKIWYEGESEYQTRMEEFVHG